MKLEPILLAILFISMIGLAGCVDDPGYYGSGYPSYGYYNSGPWWGYGREGFHHEGRFDHDREGRFDHDGFDGHAASPYRFGGAGFHNSPGFAHGGGFRGGFGGGHFGGGHFGGGGSHR